MKQEKAINKKGKVKRKNSKVRDRKKLNKGKGSKRLTLYERSQNQAAKRGTIIQKGPLLFAPNTTCVFIHINKNGGTSIETALGTKAQSHITAQEVINIIGRNKWAAAFKFAFVRNPWDKVVSHYKYRIKTQRLQADENGKHISFKEWLKAAYVDHDPRYYDTPKMFMCQFDWLVNFNGKIKMDFIGFFERFEEDFGIVMQRIGFETILPHENATEPVDFHTFYDDESREIVAKLFAKDIEFFGYSFDEKMPKKALEK